MKCDICGSKEVTHAGEYMLCFEHSKTLSRYRELKRELRRLGEELIPLRK